MAANSPSRSHSDPGETLRALAGLIDSYDATTIIALGDGAQNRSVAGDMTASDRETLNIIQEDREWIWVAPKMDRTAQSRFGGTLAPELTVEGIRLCHQPRLGAITHEVAGALHPAARLVMNGTAIRRPCFVSNGLRLIVPAFSAFSGGLNILDAAFDPLFGGDVMAVWMLGQDGLYPVAPRQLCED